MPSMSAWPFCEDVTETVVPGQTRTSPPRPSRNTAASEPALIDEPGGTFPPATERSIFEPACRGTATGWGAGVRVGTDGGFAVDCCEAGCKPCRRTAKRLPEASPG